MVELFGIRAHGSLFGMVVFFGTTGGAIGPILTGYFFDMTQSYSPININHTCMIGINFNPDFR